MDHHDALRTACCQKNLVLLHSLISWFACDSACSYRQISCMYQCMTMYVAWMVTHLQCIYTCMHVCLNILRTFQHALLDTSIKRSIFKYSIYAIASLTNWYMYIFISPRYYDGSSTFCACKASTASYSEPSPPHLAIGSISNLLPSPPPTQSTSLMFHPNERSSLSPPASQKWKIALPRTSWGTTAHAHHIPL